MRTNPEAPAAQKSESRAKAMRRALFILAYGVMPVTALVALAAFGQMQNEQPVDFADGSVIVNDSRGKSEAHRALAEWIKTDPSPLPGGTIVSWDGYSVVEQPPTENETERAAYTYEQHRFTVQRGAAFYEANVEVAVGDIVGAVATAAPTLMPIARVDRIEGLSTWFDAEPATPSEAVTAAVKTWATAFTGGDANALHQAVQDQDANRSYVPLRGVEELVSASIADTARHPSDTEGGPASTVMARVELQLWWAGGKPVLEANAREVFPAPIVYDVLIEHADTATPVVVAWGPAGSGPELKAHGNAIDVVLRPGTETDETPTPAPSDTSAPSSTGEGQGTEGEEG